MAYPGLLFFFCCPGCVGVLQAPPERIEVPGRGYLQGRTGLYVNHSPAFSILLPLGWRVQKGNPAYIRGLSPFENPQDNYRENINFVFYDLAADVQLAEFVQANATDITRQIKKSKLLHNKRVRFAGYAAQSLNLSLQLNDGVQLQVWAMLTIIKTNHKQQGLIITCLADQNKIAYYHPLFDDIMQSFQQGAPPIVTDRTPWWQIF